jgi:hypothetical protein
MRFDVLDHVEGKSVVLGHDWGEKLRRELFAKVRQLADGDTVEISFAGVEIVSTLTVSAFLVSQLDARRDERPQVGIVVTNVNEDQQDIIVKCLEFSSTSAAPLFVVCRRENGELVLLGRVDATTRATWDVACRLKEFRAVDLATALGLSPQLANNRLARLIRVGALVRSATTAESGVREYVYGLPLLPREVRRRARRKLHAG